MSVLLVLGLVTLGMMLVAIEVLVIPGIGLIGALGAAALLGGGYVAFGVVGGALGAGAFVGGLVTGGASFWLLPRTGVGKSLVLQSQTTGTSANPTLILLSGREGVALTPLRPSGAVRIDGDPDGNTIDVVTDGQYVASGTRVRVTRVVGARVIVEPVASTPA